MLYANAGAEGTNALGAYTQNSMKIGLDTSPGNANLGVSVTAFVEEQTHRMAVGLGAIGAGTSQTLGSAEAYAGLKEGESIGAAANLTVASLGANVQATLFSYGIRFGISFNVGVGAKAEVGMTTDITMNDIVGITLSVQVVTPNAAPQR